VPSDSSRSAVQASLSLQAAAPAGQLPGLPAAMALSQVSPLSSVPFPHRAAAGQSGSVLEVQPGGQQPSDVGAHSTFTS
jgi:hypothetical protein